MANENRPSWLLGENLSDSEVTPEQVYHSRRDFIKNGAYAFAAAAGSSLLFPNQAQAAADLKPTKEDLATSYNNFYEFSLDKGEVKKKVEAWKLNAKDWKVEVTGLVEEKKSYSIEDLIKLAGPTEERIYRFRCVEAWSMVVPWKGFPLQKLLAKLKPKASAKYVVFQSYGDRKVLPNISGMPYYPWPYVEGLTMEEASHPLTFIATGMYGKDLPKQNGAPIRLVVPWKYGFKSIKSIVKIEFSDKQPKTLWNELAPSEYGFYANVNPTVDHPRWTQSSERVLDGKFFPTRIPTKMFNGYEKEVASLYKGMDLKKNY